MQTATLATRALPLLALAAAASAQDSYLFSLSRSAPTLSGSAGTVLERLRPNEIHQFVISPNLCGVNSSEKWAPRTAFHTMAGDEDGDDLYWEPAMLGGIDAVLADPLTAPGGTPANLRNCYYSPAVDMAPCVSGGVGLRAGDVGRIRRNGASDGQVQYFVRAEQIQMALGLPPSPIVVNVDAVAAGPNYGVFFSLEDDHLGLSADCGVTNSRDGDVWLLPPWAISWTPQLTVGAVLPNSALRVYTENQMTIMVQNARVTDRFGACILNVGDTDALEIDWMNPIPATPVPSCTGVVAFVPHLIFAGETMTGASLLDTFSGGRIRPSGCGPLGTNCTFGPTLGNQFGIRPFSATVGWDTSINGIAVARACRFVIESPAPVKSAPDFFDMHLASPAPWTWLFATVAPAGACAVSPSLPFSPPTDCFPDLYVSGGVFMGLIPTAGGFGTYTSPTLAFPLDVVWQAVTVSGGKIQLSTPATTELL